MSAFLAGQRITAAGLNLPFPRWAHKTADESVTSSITLQDDDELYLSVTASTTYEFDAYLWWIAAEAGDIDIQFNGPTGADLRWGVAGPAAGITDVLSALGTFGNSTLGARRTLGGDGAAWCSAQLKGRLIVSTTAGTLQLQFAQTVSNATASTLRQGSWLKLTPML